MKHLKNSWKWLVAVGAVFVPSAVLAAVTIPNTFTSGTVIKSSEVNANFSALATAVNKKADAPASGSFVTTSQGRLARALVNCQAGSTCTVSRAFNPGGGITATYNNKGAYTVTFSGFDTGAGVGVPVVSVASTAVGFCRAYNWTGNNVIVNCFDASGARMDASFTVVYVK